MFIPPSSTPTRAIFPAAPSQTPNIKGIAAGTAVPMIVASIIIFARCYSRIVLIRNWGWDDSLIFVAWLCSIGNNMMGLAMTNLPQFAAISRRMIFTQGLLFQTCIVITKLSILCSYLRIVPAGRYSILSWATLYFVSCAGTVLFTLNTIVCDGSTGRAFHRQSVKCVNYQPILYCSSAFHILLDAWLIALIIPFIAKLAITKRKKIALSVVLSLGILVIIANLVRVVSVTLRQDFFAFAVWSSVELNAGLCCASAAATLPVWRKIAPRVMRKIMGTDTYLHRGDGVTTQLSRIRGGDQAVQLHSGDEPVEMKTATGTGTGTGTTRSGTERSSRISVVQPWLGLAEEGEVDGPCASRRGSRNHIVTSVDTDGTMRVTGGTILDDVVSDDSCEDISRTASRSAGEEVVLPLSPPHHRWHSRGDGSGPAHSEDVAPPPA